MATVPKLLKTARRRASLSQAELARRAGIPRSVLNAYERGTRQPGAEALASILRAGGFELRLTPAVDVTRNARVLADVLDLAERLPRRRRSQLTFPPLHRRAR